MLVYQRVYDWRGAWKATSSSMTQRQPSGNWKSQLEPDKATHWKQSPPVCAFLCSEAKVDVAHQWIRRFPPWYVVLLRHPIAGTNVSPFYKQSHESVQKRNTLLNTPTVGFLHSKPWIGGHGSPKILKFLEANHLTRALLDSKMSQQLLVWSRLYRCSSIELRQLRLEFHMPSALKRQVHSNRTWRKP